MAWKVIDSRTGDVYVSKTGKRLDNLDDETKSRFENLHSQKGDIGNYKIVRVAEPTNYSERRDYFKNTSPVLAEMFPNLAENYMLGKRGVVENIPGAIGDALSYIPRSLYALNNKALGNDEGYNLGRRSSDSGTDIVRSIATSPSLVAGLAGGSVASGAPKAASAAGKLLNLGKGAVTGALYGGADAAVNNRNPEFSDYAIGAGLGAASELVPIIAQKAKSLLSRADGDLERAVASALQLGNTERVMTEEEFARFMLDPRNEKVFNETMDAVTSGWNQSPFVTDRGKSLKPLIEDAEKNGSKPIENARLLNQSFDRSISEEIDPTKMRMERQKAALGRKDVEPYHDKTIFKPGKHDLKDDAFPTEYPEARVFSAKPGKTKTDRYQSTLEYNVERHADKWDNIGSSFSQLKGKKRPMSAEEQAFIKKMGDELSRDNKILEKYNANRLIEKNRFLRDVNPFEKNDLFNVDMEKLFSSTGGKGFSQDFLDAVGELTATARMQGEAAMNRLRSGLELKNPSAVERAFAYASGDNAEYAVAKNYKNAVDDFADALSDYADNSIAGARRTNAKGENYQVQPERMKKYAFSYLKKVQDVLRKKGALTANDVTGLYGDAVMVNDKTVQDAIMKMLRRLGIDRKTLSSFEEEAREYTMLRKARVKLRKNAVDESNPLRGTNISWLYPQEGVNTKNILFSKANRLLDGIDRKTGASRFNLGSLIRGAAYSGVPKSSEDK